jgi:F0F1-type ATP synthase assembly protein I
MDRAYLLIAGILTGAAIALLTGRFAVWIPLGVAMGVALSAAARRRPKHRAEP